MDLRGIDHTMIVVRDLDAARAAYERLGFHCTEQGRHGGLGTGNHLIILDQDYIELLGVLEPTERSAQFAQWAAAREGLYMIALATDNAAAVHDRLAAAGLPMQDLFSFKRPVETPAGGGDASFTLARTEPGVTPHAGLFFCQHHTPELVWVKEWQNHPNGARGITELVITAPDPAALQGAYERVFGASSFKVAGDTATVTTGGAPLALMTPAALRERYGALADDAPDAGPPCAAAVLKVADVGATAKVLDGNGVTHVAGANGAVVVPAAQANGLIIEFTA
ncbi:MAG: VOC family protein [Alphaproteobacteria bacterium]